MIQVFSLILVLNVIQSDISSIRKAFKAAIYSREETTKLLDELKYITEDEPLKFAYKGATHALFAHYQVNPYSKLESVKKGSAMLDDAVIVASGNIEIRYLRYSIEKNLPSFLPYRKHIAQDETRILNALLEKKDALEPHVRSEVIQYMLKNAQLSPEKKTSLEEMVN